MTSKEMKPAKAWAHVTPTSRIVGLFRPQIFKTWAEARRALGDMGKYGFRIARVEIREVKPR